ncbi:hypothetical protein DESC_740117 [Desulfosarcina cetonica]|nr:hypothetical protein DESC_740117 [Desulfosarcina cetonica]
MTPLMAEKIGSMLSIRKNALNAEPAWKPAHPYSVPSEKFLTALPLPPLPKRIEPLSENSKDERPFS